MNYKITFCSKKSAFVFFNLVLLSFSGIAQVQYMNGNLSTGPTSKSGVAAPAGYTWSELQNDAGVTTISNISSGYGAPILASISLADDFTVPAGQVWAISKFSFFAYKTGTTGAISPFDDLRVVVHSSNPALGATTILFGNLSENVLDVSSDAMMYRIINTLYPTPNLTGLTRKIWKVESTPVTLNLPAGTYWLEWRIGDTAASGSFCPASTIVGARTQPGYNAHQLTNGWLPLADAGNPATASVAVDIPFVVDYVPTFLSVDENKVSAISVYPNPVKDILALEVKNPSYSVEKLELYDIRGSKVLEQEIAKSNISQINLSGLNSGVYFAKLIDSSGKNVAIKKIVKE